MSSPNAPDRLHEKPEVNKTYVTREHIEGPPVKIKVEYVKDGRVFFRTEKALGQSIGPAKSLYNTPIGNFNARYKLAT